MACRLIGARPLPEPILTYCSIGIWKKDLENGTDIEIYVRQVRLSLSSADGDRFVQASMS